MASTISSKKIEARNSSTSKINRSLETRYLFRLIQRDQRPGKNGPPRRKFIEKDNNRNFRKNSDSNPRNRNDRRDVRDDRGGRGGRNFNDSVKVGRIGRLKGKQLQRENR